MKYRLVILIDGKNNTFALFFHQLFLFRFVLNPFAPLMMILFDGGSNNNHSSNFKILFSLRIIIQFFFSFSYSQSAKLTIIKSTEQWRERETNSFFLLLPFSRIKKNLFFFSFCCSEKFTRKKNLNNKHTRIHTHKIYLSRDKNTRIL